MRSLLTTVLTLCSLTVANLAQSAQWPLHDTSYTKDIQWDHYSILLNGRRTFVWSGELHYWRVPVPQVWRDLLEKVKAAGFNTISVYSHWAFHSANNATVDLESGARDFTSIFDIAKEVGLFVIMRGGPYVNAETTAGGFALWTTTGAYGTLRNDDPRYQDAWTPFITRINEVTEHYQFTNGGPIIISQLENEISGQRYSNGTLNTNIANYMVALEKNARDNGVIIPLSTNAPNMNSKSWSKDYLPGPGSQDIYSLDSYPSCWSCNLAECGAGSANTEFAAHFDLVSPTSPGFMAEFQGGSYNPWGGPQGGCPANHGPDFVSVFYRHLVAERMTMINLYMLYGGTNWGGLATNVVASSYDYSAPIQESRIIAEKYSETKLLGFFLRAAEDLVTTDRSNFSTSYTTLSDVGATVLHNPETGARFYVTRHTDLKSNSSADFHLHISTVATGNLTIPTYAAPIHIAGKQSKIIATDFRFGNNTLIYSTAEVLTHSIIDGESILSLWLPEGESGEFSIKGGSQRREVVSGTGGSFHVAGSNLVLSYKQQSTQSVLQFDNFRILLTPQKVAYKLWAPTLDNDPIVSANKVIIAIGPYLIRNVAISNLQIRLTGDINDATMLEVFAPSDINSIQWNGKDVLTQKTSYGSLKASLGKPSFDISQLQSTLKLSNWKYSNALPEADAEYDDSHWIVADHLTTPNPTKPSTLPVLFADDYGFHTGVQIFRGRFSGNASAINLKVQGGTAFGWSAWLNSHYLDSFPGNSTASFSTMTVPIPKDVLLDAHEQVVTVVMDHSGHDQRADAVLPRGILHASLESTSNTSFTSWKIAGNAGGEANIDPIRGPIAEGGLHAERVGWHLPGFDDSNWLSGSPSEGVKNATIAFYRTISELNVPEGYDASLEFILDAPEGSNLRAQLYVNGYQYGKFVPQVGHQIAFPVPPGILNYRGSNTIGLNLWSQSEDGASVDIKWNVLGVYESSWNPRFDATSLQPGWTSERLQYA